MIRMTARADWPVVRERFVLRLILPGLLVLACLSAASCPARSDEGKGDLLRTDVETLSSDAFEGRGIGTEGLEKALTYVEKRFEEAGLRPLGTKGYRQAFTGPGGTTLVNLIGVLGATEGEPHIIVGAHYDHLGSGEPGEANYGKIHPGADDNASGVAALLECALCLYGQGEPTHPVLFIAFSGEEKGLLGSAHYAGHPVFPLDQCAGMVNLDTVGRLFDGPLTIFGTDTAEEFTHILKGVNYGFRFELRSPEADPGGSDQVSFVRKGIPAIQIFTGPHEDYHRPGDTPDKIDYAGLERIAEFTCELVSYLADRDEVLSFVPPGAEKAAAKVPASGGGSRRVSFGSIPDFNHTGEGVLLSGVIPGSPAEKAELREGDLLIEFDGAPIEDLRGFSEILKGLSPGDEVNVVFVRDGERRTTAVTVTERK